MKKSDNASKLKAHALLAAMQKDSTAAITPEDRAVLMQLYCLPETFLRLLPRPLKWSSIQQMISKGKFPAPRRVGNKKSAALFDRDEIKEWVRERYFLQFPGAVEEFEAAFDRTRA